MVILIVGISSARPLSRHTKFPVEITSRRYTRRAHRASEQFRGKATGADPEIGFQKPDANYGRRGERKNNVEERHGRLGKADGLV